MYQNPLKENFNLDWTLNCMDVFILGKTGQILDNRITFIKFAWSHLDIGVKDDEKESSWSADDIECAKK